MCDARLLFGNRFVDDAAAITELHIRKGERDIAVRGFAGVGIDGRARVETTADEDPLFAGIEGFGGLEGRRIDATREGDGGKTKDKRVRFHVEDSFRGW